MSKFPRFVRAPGLEFLPDDHPDYLVRETGLIEKLDKHGVGHPIGHLRKWDPSWMGVHGCSGGCRKAEFYL